MPYGSKKDLPKAVKGLPSHHQAIFRAAFNNAHKEYGGDEKAAFRVAWGAVKKARLKKSMDPVLVVPLEKAWSEEARQAAADARRKEGARDPKADVRRAMKPPKHPSDPNDPYQKELGRLSAVQSYKDILAHVKDSGSEDYVDEKTSTRMSALRDDLLKHPDVSAESKKELSKLKGAGQDYDFSPGHHHVLGAAIESMRKK